MIELVGSTTQTLTLNKAASPKKGWSGPGYFGDILYSQRDVAAIFNLVNGQNLDELCQLVCECKYQIQIWIQKKGLQSVFV